MIGRPSCVIGWMPRKHSSRWRGKAKIGHARRPTPRRTRRPRYGKLLMLSVRSAGGRGSDGRGGAMVRDGGIAFVLLDAQIKGSLKSGQGGVRDRPGRRFSLFAMSGSIPQ